MEILKAMRRALGSLCERLADDPREHDPIDHPAIRRMDLAQIADLPFEPYVRAGDHGVAVRDRDTKPATVRRARSRSLPSIETVPAMASNAISSKTS